MISEHTDYMFEGAEHWLSALVEWDPLSDPEVSEATEKTREAWSEMFGENVRIALAGAWTVMNVIEINDPELQGEMFTLAVLMRAVERVDS